MAENLHACQVMVMEADAYQAMETSTTMDGTVERINQQLNDPAYTNPRWRVGSVGAEAALCIDEFTDCIANDELYRRAPEQHPHS